MGRKDKESKRNDAFLRDSLSEMKLRTVIYDSSDHVAVMTQMYGSILPKVVPYCLFNCIMAASVIYLREFKDTDLTFNHQGHTFLSVMVSFLVVSRSNITYSRFMEARSYLNDAMVACREVNQHVICFTRFNTSEEAQQWRFEISRRTVVLLRTLVNILQFPTKGQDAWKVPAITREEITVLLGSVGKSNHRAPLLLSVFLRTQIASHVHKLEPKLHVNKELKLLSFVSDFITAFQGMTMLIATPFPFPLVQMTRTANFVWVFTLPFALANDIAKLPALLFLIFFITYGFLGLEFVSMELDDPFGDDANDLDVEGLAMVVCDDIYIGIHDMDGIEAADRLKKNVSLRKQHNRLTSVQVWNNAAQDISFRKSRLYNPKVNESLVAAYETEKKVNSGASPNSSRADSAVVENDVERGRKEHPLRRERDVFYEQQIPRSTAIPLDEVFEKATDS